MMVPCFRFRADGPPEVPAGGWPGDAGRTRSQRDLATTWSPVLAAGNPQRRPIILVMTAAARTPYRELRQDAGSRVPLGSAWCFGRSFPDRLAKSGTGRTRLP